MAGADRLGKRRIQGMAAALEAPDNEFADAVHHPEVARIAETRNAKGRPDSWDRPLERSRFAGRRVHFTGIS